MLRDLRWIIILLSLTGITVNSLISCADHSMEGMIIVRAVEKGKQLAQLQSSGYKELNEAGQLVAIDPNEPNHMRPLTEEFYAAGAPDISYDAQKMLFSAKRSETDPWQIFEMDLGSLNSTQLTECSNNCTDPVYLPGGKILYSEAYKKGQGMKGFTLMVMNSDGHDQERITFSPGSYTASSILHDGRVITMNTSADSVGDDKKLMVMRPDGSKEILFYNNGIKHQLIGKGRETVTGQIVLVEKHTDLPGQLFTLDYNNPMNTRRPLSRSLPGDFIAASPKGKDHLLVCYKEPAQAVFGLYLYDLHNTGILKPVLKDDRYHFTDVVAVEKRVRPKKIPSEINLEAETGLLLCQDINFKGFQADSAVGNQGKAIKIEVLGEDSSMGIVDAEPDGSVYLKIKADTPFQLQTLDKEGKIVSGPSSWINLRPNERRACVGCHPGNEVVPENRQPLSVLKEPVLIPKQNQFMANSQ